MTVKLSLELISKNSDDVSNPKYFLWNVNWWKKNSLQWFKFWSDQYQEGCAKLFLIAWLFTPWIGIIGIIYQQRDELYYLEGWNESFHCYLIYSKNMNITKYRGESVWGMQKRYAFNQLTINWSCPFMG